MDRCLDCNALLTKEELACGQCGRTVLEKNVRPASIFASVISVMFYLSVASLFASIFLPRGPNLTLCLLFTCALLFMKRSAKDGIVTAKKR